MMGERIDFVRKGEALGWEGGRAFRGLKFNITIQNIMVQSHLF